MVSLKTFLTVPFKEILSTSFIIEYFCKFYNIKLMVLKFGNVTENDQLVNYIIPKDIS